MSGFSLSILNIRAMPLLDRVCGKPKRKSGVKSNPALLQTIGRRTGGYKTDGYET